MFFWWELCKLPPQHRYLIYSLSRASCNPREQVAIAFVTFSNIIWRVVCESKFSLWLIDGERTLIGTLRKTRQQRQRERHQTKGSMSKTMALHVNYNSWYISLASSAKQQREMTNFCVVWRTWTTTANFSYFCLELNAFAAYSAGASFNTDRQIG